MSRLYSSVRSSALYTSLEYSQSNALSSSWSPSGLALAGAYEDGAIRIWDIETRSLWWTSPFQPDSISTISLVEYTTDGRRLLVTGPGSSVKIFEIEATDQDPSVVEVARPRDSRAGGSQAFTSTFIASQSVIRVGAVAGSHLLCIWEMDLREPHRGGRDSPHWSYWNDIRDLGEVEHLAFSPDGTQLLVHAQEDCMTLVNGAGARIPLMGHAPFSRVYATCFSPCGRYVASASEDHAVRVWSTKDGECLDTFIGHHDSAHKVAFSSDGEYLASGAHDGSVFIRRVKHFIRNTDAL
ncbi:WD40-repeat-containing domain protein [Daedaleopsis nitida]|nr:WD40-repeat-containing domain protein [Daedaleopsis nitida]